jgi:hypothetical protein
MHNLPNEFTFETYYNPIDQMATLIDRENVPISTKALMQRRLALYNSTSLDLNLNTFSADIRRNWLHGVYFVGDAIIYPKEKENKGFVKVQIYSPIARGLTPTRLNLTNGALIMENYSDIQNTLEVKVSKIVCNKNLTKNEVVNNPIWRALSQEDVYLLKNYFDLVSNLTSSSEVMPISLSYLSKDSKLNLFLIGRTPISFVNGNYTLDSSQYLVGVKPHILKSLEDGSYSIPSIVQRSTVSEPNKKEPEDDKFKGKTGERFRLIELD